MPRYDRVERRQRDVKFSAELPKHKPVTLSGLQASQTFLCVTCEKYRC